MVGTTISHYKITEKIGQGGMGEVYRATDTKLNRDVALKVLPEAYTSDQQRMARFVREAQVLASLNHPNIASIYGLEEADGKQALVLELVEGEDLAARIKKGAIPLEESLEVALQIAEALESAHEEGIIHRDLKPANVKITPEGSVKVLDFGLAKALEDEAPSEDIHDSPTISQLATKAGIILGTAAYMSPEQAKGKPTDKRTDIWAFGAVLYEMLTGQRAFEGEDASEILASVIKVDIDWDKLPKDTPQVVSRWLRRCLEANLKRRLRDIGDFQLGIQDYLADPAAYEADVTAAPQPSEKRQMMPWSVAGLLAIAFLIALVVLWPTPPAEQSSIRLQVPLPPDQLINTQGGSAAILSPDGKRLAYLAGSGGTTELFVRSLDQLEGTSLYGGQRVENPFFSPDGQWVAFWTGSELKKVSVLGGAPLTLCNLENLNGASWGMDGTIIFAPGTGTTPGLFRVPAAGGAPEQITDPEDNQSHRFPQILPGGEWVLFSTGVTGSFEDANIEVLSLETGERKIVHRGGYYPRYVPTGHLVFVHEATLFAVPFDLDSLELAGSPAPILEDVSSDSTFGDAQFAFSQSGTLVYLPGRGTAGGERSFVWVDREGREEPLAAQARVYWNPRVSPDGSRLAYMAVGSNNADVWVHDVLHNTPTRLTFDPVNDFTPVWTPNSQRVVFRSQREGGVFNLYWKAADGTGQVERLTTSSSFQSPYSFSPDGKSLVFIERRPGELNDVHVLSMEDERPSQPLLQESFRETHPALSPDGRWMAYVSDESGQAEIYVRPFPNVEDGGRWQISGAGGREPVWGPDGRELFYRNGQAMMVIPIKTEPTLTRGNPQVLFTGNYFVGAGRNYDIHPDGQRFLMMMGAQTAGTSTQPRLIVVLNWFEELKRLVPMGE